MTEPLETLIAALRAELEQYGEMLARLDHQQELVAARAADKLPDTVASIQEQTAVLQAARARRDDCRRELARSLRLPETVGLRELSAALDADYRPLLAALIEENNTLLLRVQQRARQNHLLLSRSVELMQNLLSSLLNAGNGPTYQGNGTVAAASAIGALACNAMA
jgi:hypothetical protein